MDRRSAKIVGKTLVTYIVILLVLKWVKVRLVTYPLPAFLRHIVAHLTYTELVIYTVLFVLLLFIYQIHDLATP